MREWHLKAGDPLSLTLATDARLDATDYYNDQIWRITLGGGDPPALALHTTFGLRARSLRMFPRFTEGELTLTNPADFNKAPVISRLCPNFVALTFSPFPEIDVESEVWVPGSHAIAGRFKIYNPGSTPRSLQLNWVGQLTSTSGQRMASLEIEAARVLSGITDGLAPIVFMTGAPAPGPGSYPTLMQNIDLPGGSARTITWISASLNTSEKSFQQARGIAARKWDAEIARLELLNAGLVDIYTGNQEWDAAFALSQKVAYSLFVGPTPHLPHRSFVLSRQPDQGYSLRGDGSDYNHLWNGQTPLDAYTLAGLVLPASPSLAEGLLRNFISVQAEDGFIDWKPGLGGQRSRLLATPVLASLAWRIYESTEDLAFIKEIFPALLKFVDVWFTPQRDRDRDGIPEWDHPMQAGTDDHPLYSLWQPWSQGVEINTAEGPALCSFLFQECQSLMKIAGLIEETDAASALEPLAENLRIALEVSWDSTEASYYDWDRDTHFSPSGLPLGERQGPGELVLQQEFNPPIRLQVTIETNGESTRRPQVFIHGTGAAGFHRVERLSDDQIKWYLGKGSLTSPKVYTSIEQIRFQGLDPNDRVILSSVGYRSQDLSLLLPLWAGIPAQERATELVRNTITEPAKYWQPFGLPAGLGTEAAGNSLDESGAGIFQSVHLPWNALIGEGLLKYGYREEAAELVTRLMAGIILCLKNEAAFRQYYHCRNGQGLGERNPLSGLAPFNFFLQTLGVRLISPQRVALEGFNPFPWPVTVKYRGLTVLRQKEKTVVIFPNGQTAVIDEPAPRLITLE
jgi:hypothetical protein